MTIILLKSVAKLFRHDMMSKAVLESNPDVGSCNKCNK